MKIVELTIENIEELGFDAVALVEHPAMEANFYSFTQDSIEEVLLYNMLEDVTLKDIPKELVRYQELNTQRETVESYSDHSQEFKFSVEEEQQMVVGPLMIPNKMIYRVDPSTGEEYFVYFTVDTVNKIARKMMREKKLDQVNLEHVQEAVVDGHMVETWLVDDPELDKQKVYNMNYPTGTWMGMYKVEDPKAWQMVKDQEIRGFSIEGFFKNRNVQ